MKLSKRKRYFENPINDLGSITDGTSTDPALEVEIPKREEDSSLAQGNSIPDYIHL
jgi:hypothetical protein